jgi:hypothetical protein
LLTVHRRNLSPDAFKLLIGRRYNRVKRAYPVDTHTH